MLKISICTLCVMFGGLTLSAQIRYHSPSHYSALFYEQPTSTRAAGMGVTTITLDGIETAMYNPASISPVQEKLSVYLNYSSGSSPNVLLNPRFLTAGLSYKITDKLTVGAQTFHWHTNKPIWKPIIGTYNESVSRRSENAYAVHAAYQFIPGLHVGVSGNYITEQAVPGTNTATDMIFSLGAIYDREVSLFSSPKLSNQQVRVAGSFVNVTMKNKTIQRYLTHYHHRDVPIHVYLGGAYKVSLPFNMPAVQKYGYFDQTPNLVDLGLHLQYREVLGGKEPQNDNHKHSSHIAVGAEAWFKKRVALRIGYYFEDRPTGGSWATGNKRGFTWGYGTLVPLHNLSGGKIPVNAEVNFVTGRALTELSKVMTVPSIFEENKFLFSVGVNLKWAK